ncbi:PLATZ transcription factor family protein, partial [Zea mays]
MVSLREMARSDAERAPPAWLRALLETRFFDACPEHQANDAGRANRKRTSGCNFLCTHCADRALCSGCLGNHEGHGLIQIRRSSGNNVVKVDDVQNRLSVSLVQTYVYNGDYAVFLNRRPMSGHGKHGASHCEQCGRGLQDEDCRFCSLECKAKGIEDRLDFSVSFAVDPNNFSSSGDDTESDDDEDSSYPSKFQKLETIPASSSKPVASGGQHSI